MSSVCSDSSSFRKSLSIFEKNHNNRSIQRSSLRLSKAEHRPSLGSSGSFEAPPAFRTSLNIFEDGEERNPLLPSFFRDDEGNIVQRPGPLSDLKKEFEFSLKHAKLQEGPTMSVKQIIDFQSRVRGYLERKAHKKYKKFIVQAQALGRGFLQRKKFHAIVQAVIRCQSIARRYVVQREARRLYNIQNPPHIRKLRNQIAAIQLKLDAINDERECMKNERERRKAQIKKECLARFTKMERDKSLGIAQVQKSGSQLISYFQSENNALRQTMRELAQSIADLRAENKSLECDNQLVAKYTNELHTHYKKMKERNGSLKNQVEKLRNHNKPKWEDANTERENHAINESRQKYVYRQGLFRIVDHILLDQSCDSDLKIDIARVVGRCEDDFCCELDIDTPLEIYPAPPEQKSMLSAFKPDDEKSVIDAEVDEPFQFVNDADFLLAGLQCFNPSLHDDAVPSDDSSSASSSASSSSFSDSSSSTDSSTCSSKVSDNSFKRRPAESCSLRDVEKYFEQSNASTLSPIAKRHYDESSSTVCSTDESEFEVQSVSENTESFDAGKIAVYDQVEGDSDSGTAASIPPWEANDDPNVPAIINIPLGSVLDSEVHIKDQGEALTFVSTASTVAIESESSSYVDDDLMQPRNASLEESMPTMMLEIPENEEEDVQLSQLQDKGPSTLHVQRSSRCDSDLKIDHLEPKDLEKSKATSQPFKCPAENSGLTRKAGIIGVSTTNAVPQATSSPRVAEFVDQKQQRVRLPTSALTRSSTKATVENTFANPPPFRARPAPKFGEPKIPVRGRDPKKLRSKSRARARLSMSPKKS